MSNFTKLIKRTYDFDGDVVVIQMNRLKRKDALKIIPHCGEPDEDGKVKMNLTESLEFMDIASSLLLKYIVTMTGLVGSDGEEINSDYAFGEDAEAYFMNLASEVMGDLMEASFVTTKEEKKSDESPGGTLTESTQSTNSELVDMESSGG